MPLKPNYTYQDIIYNQPSRLYEPAQGSPRIIRVYGEVSRQTTENLVVALRAKFPCWVVAAIDQYGDSYMVTCNRITRAGKVDVCTEKLFEVRDNLKTIVRLDGDDFMTQKAQAKESIALFAPRERRYEGS